jgi:hypothetical protein
MLPLARTRRVVYIERLLPVVLTGHAIAQAVSRWLPTAAARVTSCGICGGQCGTRAGFLQRFRFPLPIRIPPIAPQSSSSIIWGWYNRPNSGRSTKWTQTQSHSVRGKKLYWQLQLDCRPFPLPLFSTLRGLEDVSALVCYGFVPRKPWLLLT